MGCAGQLPARRTPLGSLSAPWSSGRPCAGVWRGGIDSPPRRVARARGGGSPGAPLLPKLARPLAGAAVALAKDLEIATEACGRRSERAASSAMRQSNARSGRARAEAVPALDQLGPPRGTVK